MHNYCTYFDHRYMARGLALYQSLRRYNPDFRLWVLCLDSKVFQSLKKMQFPGLELTSLEELERLDPALLNAKANRSNVEYYFTLSPAFPRILFDLHPEIEHITYLDSDLFFLADPAPIFKEIGDASIAIISHRFSPANRHLEETGVYNVGWLTFRRDAQGIQCLDTWRSQCLDWCYDRIEPGRYADQKYLDDWPDLYSNLKIIQHKGANLAPWNLANYRLSFRQGKVWVDEQPLIFFHFQGFVRIKYWLYRINFNRFGLRPSWLVRRKIYAPYLKTLARVNQMLNKTIQGEIEISTIRHQRARPKKLGIEEVGEKTRDIFSGEYIFYINPVVL